MRFRDFLTEAPRRRYVSPHHDAFTRMGLRFNPGVSTEGSFRTGEEGDDHRYTAHIYDVHHRDDPDPLSLNDELHDHLTSQGYVKQPKASTWHRGNESSVRAGKPSGAGSSDPITVVEHTWRVE